jgi:selenocysteine-specific elongation factor
MIRAITVGTAGHIDHGKSALVRALTGIDPDRLAEEQRRGMTLDLGFAHLDLPSGRRVGIVDVPGHEALIHNMLAGAGGIDLVMLVVAADEGVMPQTREHLDILRFLRLYGGIVVLSKIDLAPDFEWAAAVEDDVARLTAGTVLEGMPVIRTSAMTGKGIGNLIGALDRLAGSVPPRSADGPARLPIDRAFTMQGFGTVVTGTLWSGTIHAGDQLVVLPAGRDVRVRGVQVHGQRLPAAYAGSRAAVNLTGVEKDEVMRGDVLATPGAFKPTDRLDVRLRLLPGWPAVRHASRLHVHLGTGAAIGRVALADRTNLQAGQEALVQLRLERPIVAVHGDPFVVRRYSPVQTLGGGVVLNASPLAGRRGAQTAAILKAVDRSGPSALLVEAVAARGQAGLPAAEAGTVAGIDRSTTAEALSAAVADGLIVQRGERLLASAVIENLRHGILEALATYHLRVPWRRGMPREDLKSRLVSGGGDRLFDSVIDELAGSGRLASWGDMVALAGHAPKISETDQHIQAGLRTAIERAAASPPALDDLRRLGDHDAVDRMLQALTDDGVIVSVNSELRFATSMVEAVRQMIAGMLRNGDDVTVATLRDRLHTSRKYALALLEYLDAARITRRAGDRRVAGPRIDQPLAPRV